MGKKMRSVHGVHMNSKKPALLKPIERGLCLAQFDDRNHPHAFGWHLYFRRDFRPDRHEKKSRRSIRG